MAVGFRFTVRPKCKVQWNATALLDNRLLRRKYFIAPPIKSQPRNCGILTRYSPFSTAAGQKLSGTQSIHFYEAYILYILDLKALCFSSYMCNFNLHVKHSLGLSSKSLNFQQLWERRFSVFKLLQFHEGLQEKIKLWYASLYLCVLTACKLVAFRGIDLVRLCKTFGTTYVQVHFASVLQLASASHLHRLYLNTIL